MAVQGLSASTAGDTSSIPGLGTKILHAMWQGQKKKQKPKTTSAKAKIQDIQHSAQGSDHQVQELVHLPNLPRQQRACQN